MLKDRIVITYPEDPIKHGDMAVLQAATDEWQDKCKHWYQYTYEQHYTNVNPVFVIQVCAGSGTKVSDTDLDDVIAKIEERMGDSFKENEVVHTFGSTGTLSIHGLTVPHIEPSEIAEDRRIRVVLFKENLSTGWDCPRAETMMSFRRAEDATYIAQLLGRMVRTPLQCHVLVDDSLMMCGYSFRISTRIPSKRLLMNCRQPKVERFRQLSMVNLLRSRTMIHGRFTTSERKRKNRRLVS